MVFPPSASNPATSGPGPPAGTATSASTPARSPAAPAAASTSTPKPKKVPAARYMHECDSPPPDRLSAVDPDLFFWHDARVLMFDIRRSKRFQDITIDEWQDACASKLNRSVVTFSPLITACLRCNSDIQFLGFLCQAKASSYYLVKYVAKEGLKPYNSLALMSTCLKKISVFPSVADDSGTDERTVKHAMQKVVNSINGATEIGAPLAALGLIGMPSNIFSHSFK